MPWRRPCFQKVACNSFWQSLSFVRLYFVSVCIDQDRDLVQSLCYQLLLGTAIWCLSAMLTRNAILGGIAVAAVAFYCKLWNVQLLKDEAVLRHQLEQHSQANEPVVLFLGRGFFVISLAAWVVLSMQSVIAGIQRARYKATVRPPLQPMSEEAASDQQQQPSAGQPTSGSSSSSKAIASAAAAARSAPAQSQQQNPQDWREQARLRALEALQRAQDEKAAVLKQQQEEEEAARKARRAKAAEEAARQKAEKEAAEAAARADAATRAEAAVREAALRRQQFVEAARAQWHGMEPPQPIQQTADGSNTAGPNAAGSHVDSLYNDMYGGSSADAAAAAAAELEMDREVRQQQDREYQQSLEQDRAKAAAKAAQRKADSAALQVQAQQQKLAALRQSVLHKLSPEPPSDEENTAVLTLRVRLPGGSQASRRFRPDQGFEQVFAWVYSLPGMPLWAPGSWALISAFPRRQLSPPGSSSWAPGVWEKQQAATAEGCGDDMLLLPGEWMLGVNTASEERLWVKVHPDSTVQDITQEIETQTGIAVDQQRLIFSGHILQSPHRTLTQLNIAPGHRLQLAVRHSSTGSSGANSSSGGGAGATGAAVASAGSTGHGDSNGAGAGSSGGQAGSDADKEASERAQELAKAADQAYLGGGGVLVVSTVGELQEEVAHGAAMLALYVEALNPQ